MGETKQIDKTKWGPGPWQDEPDRQEWKYRGLPCLAVRNQMGSWCGYVAVPPGHPAYKKPYDDVDVNVHGGLTYADHCRDHICHVPAPGEPDDVWWLGFDCGHSDDLVPSMKEFCKSLLWGTYKDLKYVVRETSELAEQLAALT